MPRMRGVTLSLLASLAASSLPPKAGAQTEMLVLTRGSDTIAVERLRRTPTRLEGELVDRVQKVRWGYAVTLAEGRVVRMENAIRRADGDPAGPALQEATLRFVRDSVLIEIRSPGAAVREQRLGTQQGATPFLNPSFGLMELLLLRLEAAGTDSVVLPVFIVSGGQTLRARVRRETADSAVITLGAESRLAVGAEGKILGGAVPAQGLTLSRAVASDAALAVPRPDYSAPAGAPYTAEEVRVPTRAGFTLAGTLTLPRERPARVPALVTITGSGGQDRDEEIPLVPGYRPFRQLADTLGRAGIAVLRMDDRGVGGSGGLGTDPTTADLAQDIVAGLEWLRQRPEIDPERIALIGHSEGGMIAPMLAAQGQPVRAIVVMAGPSQTGRRILEYQNRYAVEHNRQIAASARDSVLTAALQTLDSLTAHNRWVAWFADYDPLQAAAKVAVPVLILHGATDRQVTADQAEELARAIRAGGNSDVSLVLFPDANHLFLQDPVGDPAGYPNLPSGTIREDVIETLVSWLVDRLKPGG